ncbi:MAG: winged helix-turn-helix domain-containing protein [Woeseiaceae bacterium]|nr:winged helix-turn-helix domain-containing protein [Woeseiaceae bacterium]
MDAGADTRIFRFGEFELDLDAHQLRRQGEPVPMERRPLELLILLVSHRGRLVSREEIIAALWPGNVVIEFDTGLNTLVRKVRKALGDSTEAPSYIETVTGLGYRFIAPLDGPDRYPAGGPAVPVASNTARRTILRHAGIGILAIGLTALLTATLWQSLDRNPPEVSIAVLPFENLTGREDYDYLAAGLAEDTGTSLSRIDLPDVAVIGGMSARALTRSVLPLREIGRANDIDYFVQSSLRLDGTRIRVNSRLIRVSDSAQIWAASFDRELTNVLGLQRELSVAIAEQVRQRLSPDVAAAIDRRQTSNPEAYKLYLKGRYEWGRFLPMSVPRAVDYYRQAVGIDPEYGLAWAGIAHALVTSPITTSAEPGSVADGARTALEKAMRFAPDLAETALAEGSYYFFLESDCAAAETAARRAVALDPNSAMAHMFLGVVLSVQDQHVEAAGLLRRARELDPLFPLIFANSANLAVRAGDARSAQEFATQALAINPEFWVGYLHLGNASLALGNLESALDAYTQAVRLTDGNAADAVASRGFVLARLGRIDEAREVLGALERKATTQYVPPHAIAIIYAGLGEDEAALRWLEKLQDERSVGALDLVKDQRFAALRTNTRFRAVVGHCKTAGMAHSGRANHGA